MPDKTVKVILPNGEEVRLEGDQAEREGHLVWWRPTANYLLDALNKNPRPPLVFAGTTSASVSSHLSG